MVLPATEPTLETLRPLANDEDHRLATRLNARRKNRWSIDHMTRKIVTLIFLKLEFSFNLTHDWASKKNWISAPEWLSLLRNPRNGFKILYTRWLAKCPTTNKFTLVWLAWRTQISLGAPADTAGIKREY